MCVCVLCIYHYSLPIYFYLNIYFVVGTYKYHRYKESGITN